MFTLYIKLNIRFGYKTTKRFFSSQKHSSSTCHNNTVCACVSRVTAERSLNKTKLRGWGWPQSVCFTIARQDCAEIILSILGFKYSKDHCVLGFATFATWYSNFMVLCLWSPPSFMYNVPSGMLPSSHVSWPVLYVSRIFW